MGERGRKVGWDDLLMERINDLWVTESDEAHACDHCEAEVAGGLRISHDPNKHPSRSPGVAYLCLACGLRFNEDDPAVAATVTSRLDTQVTPREPTFALVTAVDTDRERLSVRVAGRTIDGVPYFREGCANVSVNDRVELGALARTYPEEVTARSRMTNGSP
jgi:hypothetical protein